MLNDAKHTIINHVRQRPHRYSDSRLGCEAMLVRSMIAVVANSYGSHRSTKHRPDRVTARRMLLWVDVGTPVPVKLSAPVFVIRPDRQHRTKCYGRYSKHLHEAKNLNCLLSLLGFTEIR